LRQKQSRSDILSSQGEVLRVLDVAKKSAESFSNRVGAWNQEQRSLQRGRHLAAFLAVKTDVEQALLDGHTRRAICDYLCAHGQLECSYRTFTRMVDRYITIERSSSSTQSNTHPKKTSADGFAFDPNRPTDELI